MQSLKENDFLNIAGGTSTCKEALLAMEQDGSSAYLKLCTKAQFTIYALATVDAMFSPETMHIYESGSFEQEDAFTLQLIQSLDI